MLSQPSDFVAGGTHAGQFWLFFFPALTAAVGYWATLSLNIPDFSRYARSQRVQVTGQAIGLPATMALYTFIGVAVTSCDDCDLSESEMGFRDPVKLGGAGIYESGGAGGGAGVSDAGDFGDEYRGECREPGE